MATYDDDGVRVTSQDTHGVWTTCDECREDWWCVVGERDELDEPLSWICSDGCDDEDAEEWDW
jgi:hypothetical protein